MTFPRQRERHLAAELTQRRRHLAADPTAADDQDTRGGLGAGPDGVGILERAQRHDAVELPAGQPERARRGSRGEQQSVEAEQASVGELQAGVPPHKRSGST